MITTRHYPLNEWAVYTYPPPEGTKFQYLTAKGVLEIGSCWVGYDPSNFPRPLAIQVLSYPPKKKFSRCQEVWLRQPFFTDDTYVTLAYKSEEDALKYAGSKHDVVKFMGFVEVEEDE